VLGQRQLCNSRGKFGIGQIATEEVSLGIRPAHEIPAIEAISKARRVAQQIRDPDRTVERLPRQHHRAVGPALFHADPDVRKSRDEFRDGIVELQLAILDQHHGGNRGDRLRHRIQAKDRIRVHRQFGRDIADAEIFGINRLAVLLDQEDRAGDLSGRDLVSDKG